MKSIIICFLVCITFNFGYAQNLIDPSPSCGWDSLKSSIVYPEIAKRAGLQGFGEALVEIDSVGNILDITIFTGQYVFKKPIMDAIQSTKWIPATVGDKKVEGKVSFPVLFVLKGRWDTRLIIIESEKPHIQRVTN